ncbi:MAG: aspartyl/glutamyl-tRNA amidotransferase subunit B [Phycisphaerae bacterium]|nr:aspartyl/glutamyl-tRNA amidotransferase subunit B [Phycisphaerae bacterium]
MSELEFTPIIGMEIHVQLATRTKMFCATPLAFGAEANSRTCPVCIGMPGVLPVMNRKAYEYSVMTAMALNCSIAEFTKWDRKSYYYPDLPKNYQISQYDLPLSFDGYLDIPLADGSTKRVGIIRAHLEEDAGKNVHEFPGYTGVDLNRAGTPLLEIVSQPDLSSVEEVGAYAREMQRLVQYLGVSEANMQMGHMRFEPNINLRVGKKGQAPPSPALPPSGKRGQAPFSASPGGEDEKRASPLFLASPPFEALFHTPIFEVKNLNSFRALERATTWVIEYQKQQVRQALAEGREYTLEAIGKQNWGWRDDAGVGEFQRGKEEAHDYRYFPDPDLVPVVPDAAWLEELRSRVPELPIQRRQRLCEEIGLSPVDAETIVSDRATADLFEGALGAGCDGATLGKQFISFWARYANERETTIAGLGVEAGRVAELARLTSDGTISATAAQQIAERLLDSGESAKAIAEREGLVQATDEGEHASWIDAALAGNPQAVEDALHGTAKKQKAAAGFLTGQVMKLSKGQANPQIVNQLLKRKLAELGG